MAKKLVRTALLSACMTASIFTGVAADAAAEFRLATVDLNKVLNESTQAKEKRKSLDVISTQARKKIEAKKQGVLQLEKKVKEGKLGEDSKEYQAYSSEMKNLNRLVKDSEEEIKGEFLKINKTLTDDAVKLVQQYAQDKKIDLVIDRSERVSGPVIFGSNTVDITDSIIAQMGK